MESYRQILAGNDRELVTTLLSRMQIQDLGWDEADELFLQLVPAVHTQEVAALVMEKWNDSFWANVPYAVYMFRLYGIDISKLRLLAGSVLTTASEVIMSLTESEEDPINGVGISRALEVFGEDLDVETIKALLEHAKVWDRYYAIQALEDGYRNFAPTIAKPEWIVNDFKGVGDLPTHEDLMALLPQPYQLDPFTLPSDAEIVNLLLSGLEARGFQVGFINSSWEEIMNQLQEMTADQKLTMYRPIAYELQQRDKIGSDQIFRILGPVNPLINEEYNDRLSPCARYGGCRMLTCTHLVFIEDDPEWGLVNEEPLDEREWFTGFCQICSKKIPHKFWAFRRPVPLGAWEGTYCSPNCVRRDPDVKGAEETLLISFFENLLQTKGIQNRIWS